MAVNLSVRNVPEALAAKLRARAERNHRSLQGELMAILEAATSEPRDARTESPNTSQGLATSGAGVGNLLDRLLAIAGDRGIDTTKKLTREAANDRSRLRRART